MKRLKLGLATLLALALTVSIAAGSASAASTFVAGQYPATVKGTAGPAGGWGALEFGGKSVECTPPPFTVTLASASTTLTTDGKENGSCLSTGAPSPLKMNGCKITFEPGNQVAGGSLPSYGPIYEGSFSIGPKGCGPITTDLWGGLCHLSIDPSAGFKAEVLYKGKGEGSKSYVQVDAVATELDYTGTAGYCASGNNGRWTTHWEAKATNIASESTSLRITQPGIYLSDPGTSPRRIEAHSYPKTIASGGKDAFTLTTIAGSLVCTETGFGGELGAAASELSLNATYSNCTASGLPATVAMNSCHYVLGVGSFGLPYTGTLGVACSKEGDAIEARVYFDKAQTMPACKVKIAAQGGHAGVDVANVNEAGETRLATKSEVKNVKYEVSGICKATETRTDGVISGNATLAAK